MFSRVKMRKNAVGAVAGGGGGGWWGGVGGGGGWGGGLCKAFSAWLGRIIIMYESARQTVQFSF